MRPELVGLALGGADDLEISGQDKPARRIDEDQGKSIGQDQAGITGRTGKAA